MHQQLIDACQNGHLDNNYAVRWAAGNGHLEVLKYLVSLGADIQNQNDYAVQWASSNGHLEVLKYLVSLGADIRSEYDFCCSMGFCKWAS